MQYSNRIEAIESRAVRVGWTLHRLADSVGEDYGLLRAWRAGRPHVSSVFERVCGKCEAKLDRIESEIFLALAPKFLPAEILATLDLGCLPQGEPMREVTGAASLTPVGGAAPERHHEAAE